MQIFRSSGRNLLVCPGLGNQAAMACSPLELWLINAPTSPTVLPHIRHQPIAHSLRVLGVAGQFPVEHLFFVADAEDEHQ